MRGPDERGLLPRVATFRVQLADRRGDAPPILVVRLPELERVAWRRGLRAARAVERSAAAAFSTAVQRVLRADDLVAHDAGSDVFVAALVAPTREGAPPVAVDVRSALARIAATMASVTRLEVRTGWTTLDAGLRDATTDAIVEAALERGAQERQRYAFFSSLGHELRTPLASIRGYLETLLDDRVDDATRGRFVRIAHAESMRLARLVDGMFEISLLDLTERAPSCAAGRVSDALRAAVDACAAEATERAIGVAADEPDDLWVALDGDRLTLVLVNLIGNAVKHGRRGGAVFVDVSGPAARTVRISIDDDGPGIPPDERHRVFGFGERGGTHASGAGIGLALVRLIVERAGGRVDLDPSPLGGARFVVTLPSA